MKKTGRMRKIGSKAITSAGKVGGRTSQNKFVKSTDGIEPNRADNTYRRMIANKGPYKMSKKKNKVGGM